MTQALLFFVFVYCVWSSCVECYAATPLRLVRGRSAGVDGLRVVY